MKTIGQGIFKGYVNRGFGNFPTIGLDDDKGFTIDLIQRLKEFHYNFTKKNYNVKFNFSYFISDKPKKYEELQQDLILKLSGAIFEFEFEYTHEADYSEYTNWTEYSRDFNIGNRDVIKELENYVGKWIYIKIEAIQD